MKRTLKSLAIAVAALTALAGTAAAQDYNNWGVIDPYGLQMEDEWGNIHYVDPYAHDSQVDIYGNVISSDYGQLDPSLDFHDLTPVQPDTSWSVEPLTGDDTYVPYVQPADSHEAFINSIWE